MNWLGSLISNQYLKRTQATYKHQNYLENNSKYIVHGSTYDNRVQSK